MGRLVSWPVGLRANFREPLSGPRAVSGGATQSIGNFVQTFASPFGLWRWRFSFPSIRGAMFRRYRGWVTAQHGGANATRVPFCDWDGLNFAERGIETTSAQWRQGQVWSNGQPWSNGQNWHSSNPVVAVAAAAALDHTEIKLADSFWGNGLDVGDFFGFFPFHFGLYMVTERIDAGHYRIWPPLRNAIATTDFATLNPVMAMRLESEDAANAPRGAAFAEGLSVTLVETLDYDVRDYFAD
ncbi:hypothetical protein [Allomesorhizobium alhagi]|uniref:Uncharacterized protein n=1 Tax=Mesorhizobium alhagi CCNWXJ12-2 TaxID=1107882 RepID=H0HR34_9HYPH|nr:hypothetical protein [Mesorhizobium alhagi]EHK56814.1 hypothetical protein MAXJ12_13086 [Mesorhizobium alhagi CCNWXJ12-2]